MVLRNFFNNIETSFLNLIQDAYIHVTLIKKWDLCAGNAILNALGGNMTDLKGTTIDYSGQDVKVKNEGGVLAALSRHSEFLQKLKNLNIDKN
jgi:inositol monophosphatase 3